MPSSTAIVALAAAPRRGRAVGWIQAGAQHRERHRPVHRTGVERRETERGGDAAADGRLARPGRPVDRDDSPARAGPGTAVIPGAVT